MKINMTLKKSTKNTHVYEAMGTAVPSLYIKRKEMPNPPPNTIIIEVIWE